MSAPHLVHPDALVRRYGGVAFDVDGVLTRDGEALPGACEALAALDALAIPWCCVTNNSTRTPEAAVAWLATMGLDVPRTAIVTAAEAVAERIPHSATCFVIGRDGLRTALTERGCALTDDPDTAEVVVIGADREATWSDIAGATRALGRGADFWATNTDASFPSADGMVPGAGALVAAVETASGRRAQVAGKPATPLLERAATRLVGPVLMVGDRPETDLAGADAMGWDHALVLTGVTSREDLDTVQPHPTWVLDDLGGLLAPPPPAPADLVVRTGTRSDAGQLARIWEAAGMGGYTDPAAEVARAVAGAPDLFVVAEVDGAVAGVALGSADHRRGWIMRVAVAPTARRRGVASAVVDELESRLARRGVARINLLVFPDNDDGSAFWAARGYDRGPDVAMWHTAIDRRHA